MDDIGQRLRAAADNCIKAYEAWSGSKKDLAAREALQENVHELRKVSARLEIEVAASEREDITQRQIPIPPHRASRPFRGGGNSEPNGNLPDFVTDPGNSNHDDDSIGNSVEGSESSTARPRSNPNQNRTSRPQHRRPMRRPEGNSE